MSEKLINKKVEKITAVMIGIGVICLLEAVFLTHRWAEYKREQ